MMQIPREIFETAEASVPKIRVFGIGDAGVNLADRLLVEGGLQAEVLAVNTDRQSLASSVAGDRLLIGSEATRGLGAGGDPELGAAAAEESASEIAETMEGCDLVIVCAGLGGGTGSGVAPALAGIARQSNVRVVSLVTLPFSFEGRRRSEQATKALRLLSAHSDLVLSFANDAMASLSGPKDALDQTFAAADQMLAGTVAAVIRMLTSDGVIRVRVGDLLHLGRGGNNLALCGFGAAEGSNRAYQAVESALRSPLLDRGRKLDEATRALAFIQGPASLSLPELHAIMEQVAKFTSDGCELSFGVSTSRDDDVVSVSILAVAGSLVPAKGNPVEPRRTPDPVVAPPIVQEALEEPEEAPSVPESFEEADEEVVASEAEPETSVETPGELFGKIPVISKKTPEPSKKGSVKFKQETLQFEPVARGRFEKSEPTIIGGEDLDVPTFLRQRLNVK